jgi:hypothetical protein
VGVAGMVGQNGNLIEGGRASIEEEKHHKRKLVCMIKYGV